MGKAATSWFWPFQRSRARADAERLLAAVTQVSRQPLLFGLARVPDTLEGRLEAMTLHATLALHRLAAATEAESLAQIFTDLLFRHFDAGLREAAVGDLSVPKKMRKLAARFYGRIEAYGAALRAGDAAAFEAAIARNVFGAQPSEAPFAGILARYGLATAALQAEAPIDRLFRLDGWAPAPV